MEKTTENQAAKEKTETLSEKQSARRTAIVVGASSGIGRETAKLLSQRGWRVFNISRTAFQGERVRTLTADCAQEGEVSKAVREIGEEVGSVELLVYSAGFSMAAPIEYAKSGDYRYLFEVNYFGAIEALKACVPYLTKRGGRVIFVSSMGGELPIPYDAFYSSSKAALSMLAREADLELRPRGVRVSAMLPGGTATDFTYNRRVYGEEETFSYSGQVKKATAALANIEQGGADPKSVAESIIKLSERKNPPPVTAAGGGNNFVRYLSRMLPERVTDGAVRRKFNQK